METFKKANTTANSRVVQDYKKTFSLDTFEQLGGSANPTSRYSIPFYKGDDQDDLVIWLEIFEQLKGPAGWNKEQSYSILVNALLGQSRKLLDEESAKTFSGLEAALVQEAYPRSKLGDLMDELQQMQFKPLELGVNLFLTYFDRKIKRVQHALGSKLSPALIIYYFTRTMPPYYQDKINEKDYTDLKKLVRDVESWTSTTRKKDQRRSSENPQAAKRFKMEGPGKRREDHKQASRGSKYCSKHGQCKHTTQECRDLGKSNNSNKGETKKNHPPAYTIGVNNLNSGVAGMGITLQAHVNKSASQFKALVDGGAQVSLMSPSCYQRISDDVRIIATHANAVITAVNGARLNVQGKVRVRVKLPAVSALREFEHDFFIVSDLRPEIVLGQDFLEKHSFLVDHGQRAVMLDHTLPDEPPGKAYEAMMASIPWEEKVDITVPMETQMPSSPEWNPGNLTPNPEFPSDYEINDLTTLYPSIIGTKTTVGNFSKGFHAIPLIENAKPVVCKPYRIPHTMFSFVKDEIETMLKQGIIRESQSEFASPAFVVPKKGGTGRLVINYKKLNAMTKVSRFPIPVISDLITSIGKPKVFSQLDFNSGYHQIPILPEDIHKTAFILPIGLYEFTRMPFGLTAAPMTFQKIMSKLFKDMSFVRVFIDDILIFSNTLEEHKKHLDLVCKRIAENGLTINPKKCHFLCKTVKYLGMEISAKGIVPCQDNLDAIANTPIPESKTQLRRVLGMINYFRSMIPNLSQRLVPLTSLTKHNVNFHWTEDYTKILRSILHELKTKALNTFPDYSKPFQIYVDACDTGIGAVLVQQKKLIRAFSKKLDQAQIKYTTTEKEALAIVKALEDFRTIVFGTDITIYTDHSNLLFMDSSPVPRIQRWKLKIEEFGPKIIHISGKDNVVADALSRQFQIAANHLEKDDVDIIYYPLDKEVILKQQAEEIALIGRDSYMVNYQPINFHNKELWVLKDNDKVIYIPSKARPRLIEWFHEVLSHPGINKMYQTLRTLIHWFSLKADIENYVSHCHECLSSKHKRATYGYRSKQLPTGNPWYAVGVDLKGPYLVNGENMYCFSIIDQATRWCELIAITDMTSETAAQNLEDQWLCRYPRPSILISDNGTNFKGQQFRDVLNAFGIKHAVITAYHPPANGLTERINSSIGTAMRIKMPKDFSEFGALLHQIAWSLRTTHHRILDTSPGELVFGCHMLDPSIERSRKEILEKSQTLKDKQHLRDLKRDNQKRINHKYHINDLVYLKLAPNLLRKDKRPYTGPFLISDIDEPHQKCQLKLKDAYDWFPFERLKPVASKFGENQSKRKRNVVNDD